ncbi:integrin alpha-E [Grus japonensis]|uniref:Integrin alpha-E n=1 Tax=Grus japonensis TaxID=30415 RepID=A0ABC9XK26_GRUJA
MAAAEPSLRFQAKSHTGTGIFTRVRILATSSVDKGLGRLRKCTVLQEEIQCQEIPLRGKIKGSKNIQDGGIAIDRNSDWILACLQKKHRRAFTTTEDMNGVCTLLTADLRSTAFLNLTKMVETKLNSITSKNSREKISDTSSSVSTDNTSGACGELFGSTGNNHMCKELGTEIAVILGGSENTKPDDFQNAKTSILNMMKSMWQKCSKIRFAVVQHRAQIQTELSLQESCDRLTAFFKVRNIKQQSSRTDIAAALQHVLDKVFDESCDSSQTGDKIIIVMASGQVFLENHRLRNVMNSLETAMVKLYAPEIGEFISNQWVPEELQNVGSEWFVLSTYEDFDSFLSELERETLKDSAENIPTDAPEHRNANDSGDSKLPSWVEEDKEEEEENGLPSGTEVAFILDGSGSIEPEDFERAKAFIHKMMKTLYKKCFECNFAVVQYGFEIRTEFDLRENWDPRATLQKVLDIVQVCNVTKTASAMQHVLDSIFTESHGSHKDAAKVMIVLTDGEILLDEMNLTTVINSPKMAGIERYAIGVGDAFKKPKALNELRLIASGPDDTNVFQVTNYSALDGLLSTLQQSIIGIEGMQGDALEYELAQAGFNVQILDKTGSFTMEGHLNVQVTSPFARFGFTVASIGDINGDGYEDIAVGAPLEDQLLNSSSFGSIYIFNGDKDKIRSCFSQRVKASEISSGLQYFGQSIDGGFDCTNDGLQDITVGSLENVVVLRSRPVVHFLTSMSFNPEKILTLQNNSIVTAKLCFDTISALPVSHQVALQEGLRQQDRLYCSFNFEKSDSPSSPAIHCGQPIPLTSLVSSCNCSIGHPVFKKTTANFSVIWQVDESIFQNKSAITIKITSINENSTILTEEHILDVRYAFTAVLTKPVSLMYVNVSKGLLENKEFKFNVNGENRFNATIKLQIWIPISIQGHSIITVKNASGTQKLYIFTFYSIIADITFVQFGKI